MNENEDLSDALARIVIPLRSINLMGRPELYPFCPIYCRTLEDYNRVLNAMHVKKGCLLQKVASKTDTEDDNKEIQRLDNEIDKIMSAIDTLTK